MKQTAVSTTLFFLLLTLLIAYAQPKDYTFYISTEGDDTNGGTLEAPFSSWERARQAVREVKQQAIEDEQPITVYFRAGTYPIESTFQLTAADSGSAAVPITYRSYSDEEVRLIGGQVIEGFEPLSNEEAQSRIPTEFHPNIYQTDLKAQGITDFGTIKPTGFTREMQPTALELFFAGEPMTLARYPNPDEWLRIASVPQQGEELINGGSDRVSRFGVPVGRHYGKFVYEGDRPDGWQSAKDIWLHGYWTHDWADSYVKVDRIDPTTKEFVLSEPHGVYGYTQNQKYYALNILEELDSPGEYYLDRETGILYFWPPASLDNNTTYVSILEEPMIRLDEPANVRIEGFILEGSRGEAIQIEGGRSNVIDNCTIRNLGSQAVTVNGGEQHGISGCTIYNVGDGGISIVGGDRKTLTPANHYAVDNHIHHYSRINKTYRAAVKLNGVGNRLAHNYIHDAPHTGVLFSGNEHLLEYNEVHDIAQETGDVGAFYIGRDWTKRGNVVRYNYFHHLHGPGLHGVMAVYLDDAASGTHIYGNVFYQSGRSAFIGGGHDNIVENNIFIDCAPSVHLDARGVGWASKYIQPDGSWQMYEKLQAVSYDQPPYRDQYPRLAGILERENPAMPDGNIIRRNISYGGQWLNLTDEVDTSRVTIENNYVLDQVPDNIDIEAGQFYPDDSILSNLNFEPIPWDSIAQRPSD
ncbi:MAG: right-handed parallel beta-helix repeat-containing protein [Cyclobacteriaceae bacterium]